MRGGGNSYNDSALRKRITKVEEAIKLSKSFDTYMLKQKEPGFSYDPQLPFFIGRKNVVFQLSAAVSNRILAAATNPLLEILLSTILR